MVRALLVTILAATVVLVACADDGSEEPPAGTSGPPPIDVEGITTASGLQIFDVIIGEGEEVRTGDAAAIHYTGWLENGVQFDSSQDDGEPFAFGLGSDQVIAGWDEGVVGMRPGGVRRLIVPPELGYGAQGSDNVPPNAVLTYDIELIAFGRAKEKTPTP